MAEDRDDQHEIVIVRRRGSGEDEGHHGGVWKVAFADFMTAMMAFFLVLWIVNSTSKQTRSSVARYFNPVRLSDSTPARRGLQDPKEEEFDAVHDGPIAKEAKQDARPEPGGAGQSQPQASQTSRDADAQRILDEVAESARKEGIGNLLTNFNVSATSEGILISLTDSPALPSFEVGSATPDGRTVQMISAIARSLKDRKGGLVVRGHTDARPFRGGMSDNWQLSFARAHATMSVLVQRGVEGGRIERLEGHADRLLKARNAPEAAENRRIEILLRADRP